MSDMEDLASEPPNARPAIAPGWWVCGVIVVGTAWRVWAAVTVGLGLGESYYFSCAIRPSLSYLDQPPLSLWMAQASMAIFGRGPLAARGPFILMFAGTTWMMFALGRRLFGPRAGLWAAVLLNLSAVFTLITATLLQPDGPLMFFWMATVLCLVHVFFTPSPRRATAWWMLAGVMLGLAMLSKYHAVFLVLGAGMFVVTRRGQRRWLWHPGPYLAMLVAAAIFSPVLIWNARHGWISFLWQGSRGLTSSGLRLDWLGRNLLGQAAWLLPWIWAPLLWQLWRCFRPVGPERDRPHMALMGWLAVGPVVLFTVVSAYAPVGLHFHWQAPGYLMLFVPLGAAAARGLAGGNGHARRWLVSSALATAAVLAAVTTHTATGWWRTLGPTWWSAKMGQSDDPTLEALDWSELPEAMRSRGLLGREGMFVFSLRWFQSGKADYALKGQMPVLCLHPDDSRSFAFFDRLDDWVGHDGLLVARKGFLDNNGEVSYCEKYFESIEFLQEVPIRRGGRVQRVLRLYLCRNFRGGYARRYGLR